MNPENECKYVMAAFIGGGTVWTTMQLVHPGFPISQVLCSYKFTRKMKFSTIAGMSVAFVHSN
jgi:hypothetical protein